MADDDLQARVDQAFADASRAHDIDERWLRAVAQTESGGGVDRVSHAGAVGLMQIMPDTARHLGVDPRDPVQSIHGAARLLDENLKRYGNPADAMRAYNAGTDRSRWANDETAAYPAKVMANMATIKQPEHKQDTKPSALNDSIYGWHDDAPAPASAKPALSDDIFGWDRNGSTPSVQEAAASAPLTVKQKAEVFARDTANAMGREVAKTGGGVARLIGYLGSAGHLMDNPIAGEATHIADEIDANTQRDEDAEKGDFGSGVSHGIGGLAGAILTAEAGGLALRPAAALMQGSRAGRIAGKVLTGKDGNLVTNVAHNALIGGAQSALDGSDVKGAVETGAALGAGGKLARIAADRIAGMAGGAGRLPGRIMNYLDPEGQAIKDRAAQNEKNALDAAQAERDAVEQAAHAAQADAHAQTVANAQDAVRSAAAGVADKQEALRDIEKRASVPAREVFTGERGARVITAPPSEQEVAAARAAHVESKSLHADAIKTLAEAKAAQDFHAASRADEPLETNDAPTSPEAAKTTSEQRAQEAAQTKAASKTSAFFSPEKMAAEIENAFTGPRRGLYEAETPGVWHTDPVRTGDVERAGLEANLRDQYPGAFRLHDMANADAYATHVRSTIGSPEQLEKMEVARSEFEEAHRTSAFADEGSVPTADLHATLDKHIADNRGNAAVQTALRAAKGALTEASDEDGTVTPSNLWNVRKAIGYGLQKAAAGEATHMRAAAAKLSPFMDDLANRIDDGAPGFKQYLAGYASHSSAIDSARFLQSRGLLAHSTDSGVGEVVDYNKLKGLIGQIDRNEVSVAKKGTDAITPEQEMELRKVYRDMKAELDMRKAAGTTTGSNTFKNARTQARKEGKGGLLHGAVNMGASAIGAEALGGPEGILIHGGLNALTRGLEKRRAARLEETDQILINHLLRR